MIRIDWSLKRRLLEHCSRDLLGSGGRSLCRAAEKISTILRRNDNCTHLPPSASSKGIPHKTIQLLGNLTNVKHREGKPPGPVD